MNASRWACLVGLVMLAAVGSLAAIPAAPSYDPWMWLVWGRELSGGSLDTIGGPAVKPLPMLIATALAPLGEAAPTVWVVLARAGALAGLALGGVVVARHVRGLAPGARPLVPALAGGAAVVALVLTAGTVRLAATGASEGLLLALALAGVAAAARPRRVGVILACAMGCALLRVEAWPFAVVLVAVLWGQLGPIGRRAAVVGAAVVPMLWFGLEWLGSGDPWRSGSRALTPEVGQPALADIPFVASLADALALGWWPVVLGVIAVLVPGLRGVAGASDSRGASDRAGTADPVGALRGARVLAVAGAAWVVLVAAMAQVGFSGEARYTWPGVAVLTLAAVVGWTRVALAVTIGGRGVRGVATVGAVCLLGGALAVRTGADRVAGLARDRAAVAYQHGLQVDLRRVVEGMGGRDGVLACGRPVVGARRGPMVAWRLQVAKRDVGFVVGPGAVVLQSALRDGDPVLPAADGLAVLARVGRWTARGRCAGRAAEG